MFAAHRDKELVLHGELGKWAPMSRQRVSGIVLTSADVIVHLQGAVGESVVFTYMYDSHVKMVTCQMSSSGSAKLSVMRGKCWWSQ